MLLKFTNTDSRGNPTTRRLTVVVDGDRYEIETNGSQVVEVSDAVGEYCLSEGFSVEEVSDAQEDPAQTQAVNEPEAEAEAEAEAVVDRDIDRDETEETVNNANN